MSGSHVAPYALAQVVGAVLGAELANLMYQVPLDRLSTKDRTGGHLLLGEVVATVGLVALVFALARTGRSVLAAPAVGAYIGAAYWFTSSTSFANPAVTVGRVFSDTFAGIAPGSVPGFVAAQLVGGVLAVGFVAWLYPSAKEHPMPTPAEIPQVVFACVRNGGRSVIGRVLTEHYAGGRVVAVSAGTQPGEHIHREVADVLERLGLDTSREKPTLLTRDTIAASTLAVTLGCGEECPYVPGVRYVDWPVADPGGQDDETVRGIVADIDERVRGLLHELVPDLDLPPSVLAAGSSQRDY
jgi:arsenate reductase